MGGLIGGIGALSSTGKTAKGASGAISGLVQAGEAYTAPWTNNSAETQGQIMKTLGTGTAGNPEYAQLGMSRILNPNNSYDANVIGAGYQASPGYTWQVDQSNKALEQSAAARAGLLSGATGRQLQSNTTNLANQNYWQYVTNQQQAMATDYGQRQQQLGNLFTQSGQELNATQINAGLLGSAISGTASVAGSQMGAQSSAWGNIGSGLGSLFSFV